MSNQTHFRWPQTESHDKEELSVDKVQRGDVMHSQSLEVFEQRLDPLHGAAEGEISAPAG